MGFITMACVLYTVSTDVVMYCITWCVFSLVILASLPRQQWDTEPTGGCSGAGGAFDSCRNVTKGSLHLNIG